jgi:hypothetical protein
MFKRAPSLTVAFIGAGLLTLTGCATHKDFIDTNSCKAWSEDKFKVPFVPLLPRFKIPSKAELDLACREGHAIAKPAGIQRGDNAAANLLTYRAYSIARQKVEQGDNPDYYTSVLSFADYFLREQGMSYQSLAAIFTAKPVTAPTPVPAQDNTPPVREKLPVCEGTGLTRRCDVTRIPASPAPAASAPAVQIR